MIFNIIMRVSLVAIFVIVASFLNSFGKNKNDKNRYNFFNPISPFILPSSKNIDRDKTKKITADKGIALFRRNTLHYYLNGKWQSFKLPQIKNLAKYKKLPKTLSNQKLILGHTRVIFKNKLYVGWDFGEWGGKLASFDLSEEKSNQQWQEHKLSNINKPIVKLLLDNKSQLYVARGLSHLNSTHISIYTLIDNEWRCLIFQQSKPMLPNNNSNKYTQYIKKNRQEWFRRIKGSIPFNYKNAYLVDMTLDNKGNISFLCHEYGIFKIINGDLKHYLKCDFKKIKFEQDAAEHAYIPKKFTILNNNNIYIKTNLNELLLFQKNKNSWTAKQIGLKNDFKTVN